MIYSITTEAERNILADLAKEVSNGLIVEIGALYGGVTAVLAKASPASQIITIDNFSWTPPGMQKTSKELLLFNMRQENIDNVSVIEDVSRKVGISWDKPTDLLWIDGGHDFKTVYSDLFLFAKFCKVIAMHDYNNPIWPDIKQTIDIFMTRLDNEWQIDKVVDMVVVLRKENK